MKLVNLRYRIRDNLIEWIDESISGVGAEEDVIMAARSL